MKIHIQNGRLIDPANRLDGHHDLFIADGKIVGVGSAPDGFTAERTVAPGTGVNLVRTTGCRHWPSGPPGSSPMASYWAWR